jgi:multidrug efflux pump subunit AcrA (membrane-fusion protein)
MNKVIKIAALIIIFAGLLFAAYKIFFQPEKKEGSDIIKAEEQAADQDTREASLPVKVIEAKRGDLPLRLRISATADVWDKTNIRSEVSGKIISLQCRIGGQVKKGQLLVKIDDSEKKLEVESRKATKLETLSKFLVKESTENPSNLELTEKQKIELDDLESKYKKALADFDKGLIKEAQLDQFREQYEEAMVISGSRREEVLKATEKLTDSIVALKIAELNLKRTSITSPFPGIIADIMVSQGEIVSIGQEILKIINLDSLYLKGFALESEITNLKTGIQIRIKFDAYPDRFFYGKIQSISPEVDPDKKTITIYVKVYNPENLIYPGMHAELDVEYQVFKNVLKVPRKAVIVRGEGDRPLVFALINISGSSGTADWRYVELGAQNDEDVEIKSGIQEGDTIVVDGQLTLSHQSSVRIIQ